MRPELLAPAGDLERLKIACIYGADAVYIGGPILGLRANAINFTFKTIKEGCLFAHELNKKVYVAVNIALHNKEIKKVDEYLKKLKDCKIDAVIVSDPAIIEMALDNDLEVHLSTQASTLNYETCLFWKKLGVKRIVLARETSALEIKEIIEKVDIEIECFIHGAMCAGISGRCVMSNFLTNRDANRGGCSQICRWDFNLLNEKKEIIKNDNSFTFCTKDLSMLEYIPQMIDMGIKSYKIEGRMRSVYYIATIVDTYRKAIDEYISNKKSYKYNVNYEKILRNCANRDSVPQFFNNKNDSTCQYYNGREEVSNQEFLGIIIDYDKKNKLATVEQRNYFKKGDIVEIFGPNHKIINYKFNEIFDDKNNVIEIVRHPKQIVSIIIDEPLEKYDLLRIKTK